MGVTTPKQVILAKARIQGPMAVTFSLDTGLRRWDDIGEHRPTPV
jgi:hypothetical protein